MAHVLTGQAQESSRNLPLGSPVHQQHEWMARQTPQTTLEPCRHSRLQGPGTHRQKTGAAIGESGQAIHRSVGKPGRGTSSPRAGQDPGVEAEVSKATLGAPHFTRARLLNLGLVS